MNVHISKNAELFYKALDDIWAAEQTWQGSPNITVWSCIQAVEKIMKGFLRCHNNDYDYGHELKSLLDGLMSCYKVSEEFEEYVMYLSRWTSGLRYKNMSSDPTPEDARLAISRAKHILHELSSETGSSRFINEAKEVHAKMLKSNYEKYADVDISKDKPD